MKRLAVYLLTFVLCLPICAQQDNAQQAGNAASPGIFSTDHLNFWIVAALLLAAGSLFLCLRWRTASREALRQLTRDVRMVKERHAPSVSPVGIPPGSRELKHLEQKISEQNHSIQELQQQLDQLLLQQQAVDRHVHEPSGTSLSKTFYMVGPSYNYFPLTAKVGKSEALYRFTLLNNDDEATYEIINDGLPLDGVSNYSSSYIESACEAQNRPPQPVTSIRTITPGTAFFQADRWYIKTKAIIAYE